MKLWVWAGFTAVTKLPVLGAIADLLYNIWADWRLKLTGRPDLETIVAQKTADGSRCRI